MGTCTVEATFALIETLKKQPYCDDVRIIEQKDFGDGYFLLTVSSPNLPKGYNYTKEIVLEKHGVRFKDAADT